MQEFAVRLRRLRADAGQPSYRDMARAAGYSATTLSDAAGGRQLAGLAVVQAYVAACGGDPDEWARRWREVSETVAGQRPAPAPGTPPYQGLAAFQAADAGRFFGREEFVEELAARLTRTRFLVVSGASGVGKSSVLHAGLIAAEPGATALTPGDRPGRHTAALRDAGDRLIAVDQFEEVFTLCRDEAEREEFIDLLLDLATRPGRSTRVVLGVRADFLGACARHAGLAAVMSDATVFLAPMTEDQLRLAVTGPVAQAGLTLERTLIAQVVADSRGQPGALPLLSHAMLETWRQRRSDLLTLVGYEAAGGIAGAIASTAERVHDGLDEQHRSLLRQIMVRLIAFGDGTEDTRRRVRRAELEVEGADRILDALVAARLVVVHEGAVEIAHEALIGAWPRLRQWLTEDRETLVSHRRLTEAAQLWESLDRDPGALLRGTRLAIAAEWVQRERSAPALTAGERSFYEASRAAEVAELRAVKDRARQLKRLSTVLAALLVCVALAGGVAVWQWRSALAATRLATSRDLASHATRISATDVPGGMRLSLDAYAAAPTVDARGALLSIAGRPAYDGQLTHGEPVKEAAFSPDGTVLVAATQDPTLVVWDVAHRTELARLEDGHKSAVRAVAVGPGHVVVSGGLDGSVVEWDYQRAKVLRVLRPPSNSQKRLESVAISPDGSLVAVSARGLPTELWHLPDGAPVGRLADLGDLLTRVAFSPDGHRLVSAGVDPVDPRDVVSLWNVDTRTLIARSPLLDAAPQSVAFSPDGHTVGIASEQMADVMLWDTADGSLSRLRGHTHSVRQLAFSPDGSRLVSGGFDEFAIVWDVRRKALVTKLFGHSSELYTVAYSPDGRTIATGSKDRRILLFDLAEQPFTGHVDRVNGIAASPDGRLLASASKDATVVVWDPATRKTVTVLTGNTARVADVAFSPDSRLLASAGDDRTFRVWDTRTWAMRTFTGPKDLPVAVVFSPDSRLLAATYPAQVVVVDTATGAVRSTVAVPKNRKFTRAVFRDEHTLVLGGDDTTVWIHPLDGVPGADVALHNPAPVLDVAVDPGRRWLAVGTADGSVTVWNLADGTGRTLPNVHNGLVALVRFSPDGRFLASSGTDQNIDVWDVASLTLWARLTGHQYDVQGLTFSPSGTTLYSGSIDQTVSAWPLDPAAAVRTICAALRDNFHTAPSTPDECAAG
ncbi:nSTAND1 domain-containing NTPase [Hamadaea tsunoensis]|uniref:nSTAND1 domain-containing NTPase n=1 Tax=Hamadaea tsunoensis TaxID=53368 RepID=UPI00042912A6|nr:helix-turn-helix domain-containing protein [Hamadaea tsunoensis]